MDSFWQWHSDGLFQVLLLFCKLWHCMWFLTCPVICIPGCRPPNTRSSDVRDSTSTRSEVSEEERRQVVQMLLDGHEWGRAKESAKTRKSCPVCKATGIFKLGALRKDTGLPRKEYKKYSKGCKTCGVMLCPEHWNEYHAKYMGVGEKVPDELWA